VICCWLFTSGTAQFTLKPGEGAHSQTTVRTLLYYCAVISNFTNGVALIAAQLANRSWVLAFSSPSWNLTQGETIPIDLTLDGQAQFRVFGVAKNSKLLSAPLPEVAVSRLRKSQLLVASGLSPAAPAPAPAGPVQLTPPSGKVFQLRARTPR
jgi:hypothetical protein